MTASVASGMTTDRAGRPLPRRASSRSRAPVHTASRYFPKSRDCIPDRFRWALGRVIDDLPVAAWLVMGAEPEEGLKRGVWIAASVVTKDVLIQVHG